MFSACLFTGGAVADFRRQLEVNAIGPVIGTKAFAPQLGADPSPEGPGGRS
jgi:NAD(P)-dependent dehydrogenase (short-subunit alcohol dehydrogenase family)